ncbi:hypothetical protein NPIL_303581 [Nephila pilipes]|uniref:Uncharacterized protein n=1 Tax=Nephila pilipes TaxID=299642 RepID=A0A8X6QKX7_NEPPI|nr:hypothetical protein NPIL_303581 [Nephila pilipes]
MEKRKRTGDELSSLSSKDLQVIASLRSGLEEESPGGCSPLLSILPSPHLLSRERFHARPNTASEIRSLMDKSSFASIASQEDSEDIRWIWY